MEKLFKDMYLFGAVKVGERGQVVIPKEARVMFKIMPGESLLVLGHKERGIALAKADLMKSAAMKIIGEISSVAGKSRRK